MKLYGLKNQLTGKMLTVDPYAVMYDGRPRMVFTFEEAGRMIFHGYLSSYTTGKTAGAQPLWDESTAESPCNRFAGYLEVVEFTLS